MSDPTPRPSRFVALSLPDPVPTTDLRCADCGAPLVLKVGTWGLYWACAENPVTGCKGHLGAHQESGKPLGVPATAETRLARRAVHDAFDKLWNHGEDGRKTRRRLAYAWLALRLGVEGEAHIGELDGEGCARALAALETFTVEVFDDPAVIARATADRRQ